MFVESFDLQTIKPAIYNPRKIDAAAFAKLRQSVRELGIIKPIIVDSETKTIIAGHQRTKGCLAEGITHAPVFLVRLKSAQDEVRFNQIHNGADIEEGGGLTVAPSTIEGWEYSSVNGKPATLRGGQISLLSQLIMRYGNFGCCIADFSGRVWQHSTYAWACHLLGITPRVFYLNDEKIRRCTGFFGEEYGSFTYEHIERKTFLQNKAQRVRGESDRTKHTGHGRSRLYAKLVPTYIQKSDRCLDFGSGFGQEAAVRNAEGYHILPIEFFFKKKGKNAIDTSAVLARVSEMKQSLKEHGLFDSVILDSVLNSTDSIEAEKAVLGTCAAFLKEGGRFICSARSIEVEKTRSQLKRRSTKGVDAYFYDESGFTANYYNGGWFFQKMHTEEQLREILSPYFRDIVITKDSSMLHVACLRKSGNWSEELERSIRFEFTLPLPNGRYHLAEGVLTILRELYLNTREDITAPEQKKRSAKGTSKK